MTNNIMYLLNGGKCSSNEIHETYKQLLQKQVISIPNSKI